MSRNPVQFQRGYSLSAFFDEYGTEAQCEEALFRWRWPNGFICPECGWHGYGALKCGRLFQCHRCHRQSSLISGTVFASTKLPLRTWFLAMYLLTQTKNGISALELHRQLGVSYNTAWGMKHKLMQAMKERDDSQPLRGVSSRLTMPTGVASAVVARWGAAHRARRRLSPRSRPTQTDARARCV